MGRFRVLYVLRSDGKLETKTTHGHKERNEPTTEQLDSKPNAAGASDYYRRVAIDEQKHMDWRRKLGSMLSQDLGLAGPGMSSTTALSCTFECPENTNLWKRQGFHPSRLP